VAVEFGSLSKIFNMTGWRIGWVVGNPVAIEALGRVKTNIDSGIFNAVQRAGLAALRSDMPHLPGLVATYQRRRDRIMEVFWEAGWKVEAPKGALYLWLPTPPGESSVRFTQRLLDDAGVVVAPGSGYGPSGEGYVRLSLTIPDARLEEGCERVRKALVG
jgi:LL-diaminopimelate aminotransferase